MKKYDVLVIGELNVDLILSKLHDLPEIGKEIIADDMHLTLGSSSAIFASNLSVIGAEVAFFGLIGNDDFGNQILNTLAQQGVSTEFILRHSRYKTGATIALSYGENRAMVTFPGAMEHLNARDITLQMFEECRHLHVSSVFLQPGIQYNLAQIFGHAKKTGLTTSLDTQWDPRENWDLDLHEILPLVDIFFPNQNELLALTKTGDVQSALDSLKDFSNILAVKMGSKGALAYHQGNKLMLDAFENPGLIDAIGAGDSFNAGFVFKFLQEADLETCLRFGNLMGAINTTAPGGTGAFTDPEQVKKTAREIFNIQIDK